MSFIAIFWQAQDIQDKVYTIDLRVNECKVKAVVSFFSSRHRCMNENTTNPLYQQERQGR